MMPVFKNRLNEKKYLTSGEEVWISRSVVVIACIHAEEHILLARRGQSLDSGAGLWSLPCGFLDYDETAFNAVRREVWEELGLEITEEQEDIQPFYVHSKPLTKTQSVTLAYAICFTSMDFVLEKIEKNKIVPNREVEEVKFVKFDEANNMKLAFHHSTILSQLLMER